jgi:hypothetical protein
MTLRQRKRLSWLNKSFPLRQSIWERSPRRNAAPGCVCRGIPTFVVRAPSPSAGTKQRLLGWEEFEIFLDAVARSLSPEELETFLQE